MAWAFQSRKSPAALELRLPLIFDQTITFRHKELVQAAKAINEAAARLAGKHNAQAMKLLDDARATPPARNGAAEALQR